MHEIFKGLINRGGYDLNDIITKIGKYHVEGILTDTQRDELTTMARQHANPHGSYGAWQDEVDAIWAAIRVIQAQLAGTPAEPAEPADEWPEYVQPTGAHDAYAQGAQVTYNGTRYVSTRDGNVWSPDAYPDGWEMVA